jgi:hypothetical protein
VVERAREWINECRAIAVHWNKKARSYLGLIDLAISFLWYRGVLQRGPPTIQEGVLG